MSEGWLKISALATIFLIGVPTAAGFYPPLFAGAASVLPLDLILPWMGRFGILLLGVIIGWVVRGRAVEDVGETTDDSEQTAQEQSKEQSSNENNSWNLDTIQGCIEMDGVLWKGEAKISNGNVEETDLIYKAICPKCQTVMYDGTRRTGVAVATNKTTYWNCPNSKCGHRTVDDFDKYRNAENIFDSEVRKLVESKNKPYSLESIKDDIQSPEKIWEEYSNIVDSPHVSTDCFY